MSDTRKSRALIATLYTIGATPFNVVPLTIGALIGIFAVSEDAAGGLLTAQLFTMAVVAYLLAPLGLRALNRKLVISACILSVVSALWAAEIDSFGALYQALIPAGVAAGLLILVVNVAVAQAPDPVRVYGIAVFVVALVAIGFLLGMPVAIERFALRGAFWPLAALALLTSPIWLRINIEDIRTSSAVVDDGPVSKVKYSFVVVALYVVGNFIVQVSQSSYFAFVERKAAGLQIDAATIGLILGGAYTTNLLATALASWIGERFGYIKPLVVSVGIHSIAAWTALTADNVVIYTAAVVVQSFSYFLSIPFQLGIGATLDPSGKLATVGAATFFLGLAMGPLLGGLVIANSGFVPLGNLVVAGTAAGLVLYAFALRRHFGGDW